MDESRPEPAEGSMDDPRWEAGMPVLHRQAIGRRQDRIPETAPTPLQKQYINLSAVALVLGFVSITALNLGFPPNSPLVKLCVLIGAPILVVTTADAALRFWRSAMAWLPIDRGRGLFRIAWVAAALLGIAVIAALAAVVLLA